MITLSSKDASKLQALINDIKIPSSSAVCAFIDRLQNEINSLCLSEATIGEALSIVNVAIEHTNADEARIYRPIPRQITKASDDEMTLFCYIMEINSQSKQNEISNDIGR